MNICSRKALLLTMCLLYICAPKSLATADQTGATRYYHNAYAPLEICYHATPMCIHADTSTKDIITLEEAQALGLLPCPVCVQEAADPQGVRAVARGGTYVLKMTDEWMNTRQDIGDVFGSLSSGIYAGYGMIEPLAERLHGDAYVAFCEAMISGGTASAPAYYPGIYPQNGELQMCQRHVGSAWYTVLRPDEAARKTMDRQGKLKIYLRFFGGEASYESGALTLGEGESSYKTGKLTLGEGESSYKTGKLTLGEGDEWGDDEYELKFEKMDSAAVFNKEYDGLTLSLFEEIGASIFVLREHGADADLLEDVGLSLDGFHTDLSLTGYMDGTDAVFVGVFTAPEAKRVKDGATVALEREP